MLQCSAEDGQGNDERRNCYACERQYCIDAGYSSTYEPIEKNIVKDGTCTHYRTKQDDPGRRAVGVNRLQPFYQEVEG